MISTRWLYIARHATCGHSRAACVVDTTNQSDVKHGERFIDEHHRYKIEKTQDINRFTLDDCEVCR